MKTFGTYKRVCLFGIDGMGAFNRNAETPNMDALFAGGAVTYGALSCKPTVSSINWTAMLTGVNPEWHLNNDMQILDGYPTIFARLRALYPDAELAAFSGWSPIVDEIITADPLSVGICPTDSGIAGDGDMSTLILEYMKDHDPMMLFIQLDETDEVGHGHGYGFSEHLACISRADAILGKLISVYRERGLFDDTLFIVTADHGGTVHGSHGDWSDGERFVFLGVAGKGVLHGEIGAAATRDIPAIIMHAFGLETPAFEARGFAAQMPEGIFPDAVIRPRQQLYPDYIPIAHRLRVQPMPGDDDYIGNFIEMDRIRFYQTFEEGVEDVTGNCTVTTERGIIKRYSSDEGGFIGKFGEFGGGTLRVDGLTHGPVFSIGMWYLTTSDCRWMDLISNADGEHDSFAIVPYGERVGIYIKAPDGEQYGYTRVCEDTFEAPVHNRWSHYLFEVDTVRDEIRCYVNFKLEETFTVGRPLASHFAGGMLRMSAAQHMNERFYKIADDIMVIDGAAPIDALKAYYQI